MKTVEVEFKMVDGVRKLVEREGTEKTLPCELLLVAAGFVGCEEYTANAFDVELGERGCVKSVIQNSQEPAKSFSTSPTGFATTKEKVFACGDMHRGQSLVVWAIAEGRECALQIDEYLAFDTDR